MLFLCLFCLLSESESAPLLLMPAMSATGSSRFAKASAVNSSMLLIKIFRGLSILAKPLDVYVWIDNGDLSFKLVFLL